ncbi:hypothetical protein KAI92_03680 [Candidatus Parcubacteria bacterium]|nr:hypothetical protein [Candidatus Parcubacteria bacterium]
MTKRAFVLFLTLFSFFVWTNVVHAGFGISPPYVKTSKPIFIGGHYEQKVTLKRSLADVDLQAKIMVNAPEIADWITIDKGEIFDLPKDQLNVPMIVRIDVPKDAEIGNYRGHINIRVIPKDERKGGGVAIALGARVDIDITVTDETFLDFKIIKVDIPDFEVLKKPWSWSLFSRLFYKSKVVIKLENTGNVEVSPSKVTFDVLDLSKNNLLEFSEDTKFEKVAPFKIASIVAKFPTRLEPGQYWGKVKIYNDKNIIRKEELVFTVGKAGEFGGTKLGVLPYLMMTVLVLLVFIFIVLLVKVRSWRVLLYFIIPFVFIFKQISLLCGSIKNKFWKWLYKKSSEHRDEEFNNQRKK